MVRTTQWWCTIRSQIAGRRLRLIQQDVQKDLRQQWMVSCSSLAETTTVSLGEASSRRRKPSRLRYCHLRNWSRREIPLRQDNQSIPLLLHLVGSLLLVVTDMTCLSANV